MMNEKYFSIKVLDRKIVIYYKSERQLIIDSFLSDLITCQKRSLAIKNIFVLAITGTNVV